MRVYFLDVTLKVEHQGRPVRAVVPKAARADSELSARRSVLDHYLVLGFQVIRLDRAGERTPGVDSLG